MIPTTRVSDLDVVAVGLQGPEGPVILPDGSLLVSEMTGFAIARVALDGTVVRVCTVAGLPNGLAFGPDGDLYCANMGRLLDPEAVLHTYPDYPRADIERLGQEKGAIQRIDLTAGTVENVITHDDELVELRSPDDLVFDDAGGFYFTDLGLADPAGRNADLTGIYYGAPDGTVRKLLGSATGTNGVALSPDAEWLYWTEYLTGRLFRRRIVEPGVLASGSAVTDCIHVHPAPLTFYDSLTIDAAGGLAIAVHNGVDVAQSGILRLTPTGVPVEFFQIDDLYVTHIAISPTAPVGYVTLSTSGRIVRLPWPELGQTPRFHDRISGR